MKLYTEEQVKDTFIRGILKGMAGSTISTNELFEMYISEQTPIELPNDEDIDKEASTIFIFGADQGKFIAGAKWVIEQIKQQENGK